MILAYAVTASGEIDVPPPLHILSRPHVQCFYRERADAPQSNESEIREFFRANQALFAQTDIIEFRFPTIVRDISELEEFLARHEATILSDLERLRGLAQLTVYLPQRSTATTEAAASGTDYLRKRRAQMAGDLAAIDAVRAVAGPELRDSALESNRLLLLLPRQVASQLMAKMKAETGHEVAGPFPPSGFSKLLS